MTFPIGTPILIVMKAFNDFITPDKIQVIEFDESDDIDQNLSNITDRYDPNSDISAFIIQRALDQMLSRSFDHTRTAANSQKPSSKTTPNNRSYISKA